MYKNEYGEVAKYFIEKTFFGQPIDKYTAVFFVRFCEGRVFISLPKSQAIVCYSLNPSVHGEIRGVEVLENGTKTVFHIPLDQFINHLTLTDPMDQIYAGLIPHDILRTLHKDVQLYYQKLTAQ